MNVIICLIILLLGINRLRKEYPSDMPDWLTLATEKWLGAATGSVVAVIFRPSKDGWARLVIRWVIGTWVGGMATEAVISMAGLGKTDDMILFVASGLSVSGYMLIEIILSNEIREALRAWLAKRAEK